MKDYFRPLRITHGYFGYSEEDSFEDKVGKIERRIKELKAKGFGGIVTNVGDVDYLHNETEWKLMREKERICRENDMRMWLYDEKGYPSGGAWKETLTKRPDCEARALVVVAEVLKPGESKTFELPYGHEKTLCVAGYTMQGDLITDEELDQGPVISRKSDISGLKNESNVNMLALGFYVKRAFEGAHCQNNVCASRRYIDVSSEEAVREFITNTYERYTANLAGHFAKEIGDPRPEATVEAIFTDEPSYMGHYINQGINTPRIDHVPDPEIKLYPVINWGMHVVEKFKELYGYDLTDELVYLFAGGSDRARQVRHDYNNLMSLLFEHSFFEQIGKFCESKGLMFSGHVLLEDELKLHVRFEGNIMRFLSHMHVPGLDMLQSVPEIVRQFAFTPLLVRSAAELYGRKHVMDEVSAHAQGGNVTEQQVACSLMLQLALGADVFTSYYNDGQYGEAFWNDMNNGISLASSTLGERDSGRAIIYYPIDTVMSLQKPGTTFDNAPGEQALIDRCQENLESAMNLFVDNMIPFIFADPDGINEALARKPELVVVPGCLLTAKTKKFIEALAGCSRVVFYDPRQAFESEYEAAAAAGAAPVAGDGAAAALCNSGAVANLRKGLPAGGLTTEASGVVAAFGRAPGGARTALVVNSASTEARVNLNAAAKAPSAAAPLQATPAPQLTGNGGAYTLLLPPYASALVTWSD